MKKINQCSPRSRKGMKHLYHLSMIRMSLSDPKLSENNDKESVEQEEKKSSCGKGECFQLSLPELQDVKSSYFIVPCLVKL